MPGEGAQAKICVPVAGDAAAFVGDNRKLLVCKLEEVPEISRGRGVILQRYQDGGLADARPLVGLPAGIAATVNLMPFNPWPGSGFECSRRVCIERFAWVLPDAGYASPVREPRGRDILAACGQLRSESLRARRKPHADAVEAS